MVTLLEVISVLVFLFFFFQAEDGIRDGRVTGVQTCALPIYLEQVHEAAGVDLGARAALAARMRGDAGLAVDRLREDPREGGLAHATRPREEVRVVQSLRFEGVGERLDDVRLSDDLLEDPRSPLTGQNLIGHGN